MTRNTDHGIAAFVAQLCDGGGLHVECHHALRAELGHAVCVGGEPDGGAASSPAASPRRECVGRYSAPVTLCTTTSGRINVPIGVSFVHPAGDPHDDDVVDGHRVEQRLRAAGGEVDAHPGDDADDLAAVQRSRVDGDVAHLRLGERQLLDQRRELHRHGADERDPGIVREFHAVSLPTLAPARHWRRRGSCRRRSAAGRRARGCGRRSRPARAGSRCTRPASPASPRAGRSG